jgi:arylsulfatase A-like enzyme
LLVALLTGACGSGEEPSRRPNLLFVSIDTLRADHLSCYGYEQATSPRLDELAARSQRFESAWSVMATTLPSHTAMFTSLSPAMSGASSNGDVVVPQAHTLAERLTEAGFATGAFVSAAPLHPRFGLEQGFSVYDHPVREERPGDKTRARAVEWLRSKRSERFFCFVHLFDPHTWYTAPEAERALFGAPEGRQPPERTFLAQPERFDADARSGLTKAYDAEIRFADAQLGQLLDELTALGLSESTVVVVTSDHGETLEELIDTHRYGYDHGEFLHRRELRVPLVVHVPGSSAAAAARVHSRTVSLLDVLPTVLELLEVPRSGLMLGRSLVPLLEGRELASRPVFSERRALTLAEVQEPPSALLVGEEFSVASEDWHFVRGQGRPEELYDLRADPRAESNVAPAHPAEVARLGGLLEAWRTAQAEAGALATAGESSIDPELLQALRALGYAADERP